MTTFALQDAVYTLENRRKTPNLMPQGGGIYAIRHKESGKCYVGQTVVFAMRIYEHLKNLRRGRHGTPKLQKAFNEYGESAFDFVVLENMWEGFGPEHDRAENYWIRLMTEGCGTYNCDMEIKRAFSHPKSILPLSSQQKYLLEQAAASEIILKEDKFGFYYRGETYSRESVLKLRRAGYLIPVRKIRPSYFAYQAAALGIDLNIQFKLPDGGVEE